jgi:hypothetical protein
MKVKHRLEALIIATGLALGIVAVSPQPVHAARPCVENFSEAAEGNAGKVFKSFIDVRGTTAEKIYVVIGRDLAKSGYLGIDVNKDLGILSAYQEARGLKLTVIATVTETDPGTLRIELDQRVPKGMRMPTATARDGLCETLELTLPAGERANPVLDSSISLKGQGSGTPIKSVVGQFRKAGMDPFITLWFDFVGSQSNLRVIEKRPVLLVRAKADPSKAYVLVKCDSDKRADKRSIKIGSFRKLLKMGFTGAGEFEPDEDQIVPTISTEESPGLWRIVPSRDLSHGEYGLWDAQGYGVAFFGVD